MKLSPALLGLLCPLSAPALLLMGACEGAHNEAVVEPVLVPIAAPSAPPVEPAAPSAPIAPAPSAPAISDDASVVQGVPQTERASKAANTPPGFSDGYCGPCGMG